jgi:RNA polymerase sigma-70 factor (ECF subfamily)
MRDPHGFDEFYRGTRSRTLTYLYSVGGDLAEAQDASQEAYARAWQHWSTVSQAEHPEAWVRTVGWRVLAHRWRSARVRRRVLAQRGDAPSSVAPPNENTVTLVSALRQLPEPQRQAIVLHHLLDLPVVQVAAETGVAVGTVKARLSRGRAALAQILGSQLQEVDNA